MLAITAVRIASGGSHSAHISRIKWLQVQDGRAGDLSSQEMITFMREHPETPVVVGGSDGWASVEVVQSTGGLYPRSHRDNTETDNLLQLPRF
jgi:hypothetical protein